MGKLTSGRRSEYLQTAMRVIHENGGQSPVKDILQKVRERLSFSDYEMEIYKSNGSVRWETIMFFRSIGATKAGWIRKKNGIWFITDEGIETLKLPPTEFGKLLHEKYWEWKAKQGNELKEDQEESGEQIARQTAYEQAVPRAKSEIEEFINERNPYEFQDIVAALLRGMGYYTPFIAPKGPDGGLDIIAYKDPFGSTPPRMKVQVKHKQNKVVTKDVRELCSLLKKDGETGLIVSSGGFTSEAEREIRSSDKHMEKINLDDLIDLWEKYYDNMSQEDKMLLPIKRVAYLAPNE
jgi:restriction system protein